MNVAIFLWHGKVVKSKMTIFGADIDIILSFVEVISSNNNIFSDLVFHGEMFNILLLLLLSRYGEIVILECCSLTLLSMFPLQ